VLNLIRTVAGSARSSFRTERDLALENLALCHQIGVLTRAVTTEYPVCAVRSTVG